MVAGKSKAKSRALYAGLEVRPCFHLHFDESKGASRPDHERLHNMFLSEGRLATIIGQSIKIATKSLSLWDLALYLESQTPVLTHIECISREGLQRAEEEEADSDVAVVYDHR